jgi:predicted phage terminase large subunit-like protein
MSLSSKSIISLSGKYRPTKKQREFHQATENRVPEVLYGGAVGGGKSVAIIMDALKYAFVYQGSSLIIFRRTYPELEASIIKKCLEFYPISLYKYNDSKKRITFVNGSTLSFGYLKNSDDWTRYQGGEYSYIGFDELTHFDEENFTLVLTRLRNDKSYPNLVRCTSNPIPYQEWVKQRYIVSDDSNKLYIPATLNDNPYLDTEEYAQRLATLPKVQKEALLEGKWDLFFGEVFNKKDFVIISKDDYNSMTTSSIVTIMAIDVAVTTKDSSDYSAISIGSTDENNNLYIHDVIQLKLNSHKLMLKIIEKIKEYNCGYIAIEDSAISKTFIENFESLVQSRAIPVIVERLSPNGRNKEARIQQYMLSQINQNRLYFVESIPKELYIEAINFPNSKNDDTLDALAYLIEYSKMIPIESNVEYLDDRFEIEGWY